MPKKKNKSFRDLFIKNDVSATIGDIYDNKERIKREIEAYLSMPDTTDIEQGLSKFPSVRELFLKYNCIRSSEAICERMFSYAGECICYCFHFLIQ